MYILHASRLALVTTGRMPFFVETAGLEVVMDVTETRMVDVCVYLRGNKLLPNQDGFVMAMHWPRTGRVAIFFVYSSELHFGTLGVRRIQRAWRAWRSRRRRLAFCMASLGADPGLMRMLRVLCVPDLLRCAETSGPPPPAATP